MSLQDLPSLMYLLLVIVLGLIVGIENEYRKLNGAKIFFGLRTSIFISILGYVFSLLYLLIDNIGAILGGVATIIVISTSLYIEKTKFSRSPGATTYASVFIMFFSGMLVGLGAYQYAIVITILLAAISIYKREFISTIHKITRKELLAAINLLLIAFVVLFFLPDTYLGPYSIFNPFEFWVIVATVGFVFFLQYLALKISNRGLMFSSVIGSLITSTAVAFDLIRIGNRTKGASKSIFYNIMFASNLPMILVQGLLFAFVITLSSYVAYYLIPVIVVSMVPLVLLMYKGRKNFEQKVKKPSSPFPIIETMEFAVIFFAIFTISRAVSILDPGLLIVSTFLSGLANVASTVLAVSFLYLHGGITAAYTAFLIGLSISAGLIMKGMLGFMSKDKYVKTRLIAYSVAIGLASLVTSVISYYGI